MQTMLQFSAIANSKLETAIISISLVYPGSNKGKKKSNLIIIIDRMNKQEQTVALQWAIKDFNILNL